MRADVPTAPTRPVGALAATIVRQYIRYAPGNLLKAPLVDRYLDDRLRRHDLRRIATTRFGARLAVATHDCIPRFIHMFGVWEPNLTDWIARRLSLGDVFVDVGANIGYFSVLASKLVGPAGRVVAIEPSPHVLPLLERNLALNGCDNVRVVACAAGDHHETVPFFVRRRNNLGGTSRFRRDRALTPAFHAEARPLPDLLTPEEVARARIIKIDVEGSEAAVIRSLTPILGLLRPDAEVTAEIIPKLVTATGGVAAVIAPLVDSGFHTYRIPNDYRPSSYLDWRTPQPPTPWCGRADADLDLVFSRIRAEEL